MNLRKISTLLTALCVTVALAACGNGSASPGGTGASGGGDQPYVAIVSKGFSQQFWQIVKSGAEDAAKEKNVRITFVGPPTESAVETQIQELTDALSANPDAIGFAALDSRAAAPLLQQAKERNIPVIGFDSGVDSDIPLTTVATDNKAAAAEAAKQMADKLGGKGTIAVIAHDQTSLSGKDRRDGFLDWMKQNAPGITILPVQYSASDQTKAADIAKSFVQANPDLAGIFGTNEASATGMVKGVQETGKQGLVLAGFDSGTAQINAIKSGDMAGSVTQDPYGMGQKLVESAVQAINGESLPASVDTGYYWYDSTNLDDPNIARALYE